MCPAPAHAAGALRDYIAAPHQSAWQAEISSASCELHHVVPRYGTARFISTDGRSLAFSLEPYDPGASPGELLVAVAAPGWRADIGGQDLSRLPFDTGALPLRLPHRLTRDLLLSLEQGSHPAFLYPDGEMNRVRVRLNNVGFAGAAERFRRCLRRVRDLRQATDLSISFAIDSTVIDEAARQSLRRLVAELRDNPDIKRIQLSGRTDVSGAAEYNLKLSQQRALTVFNFLLKAGVPAERMQVVALGESDHGGAGHRRVEISLIR